MELFDRRTAPKRADTWFVYGLVDSREPEEIRYIGITNNPRSRLSDHHRLAHSEGWKKSNWLSSVLSDAASVKMAILSDGLTHEAAKQSEVALIAEHRAISGERLTNLTLGGDGVSGVVRSSKWRKLQSSAKKLYFASPEGREKTAAAARRRFEDPEERAKIGDIHRGKIITLDHRAKISVSMVSRYEDPAAREETGTLTRLALADPAVRARMLEATIRRYEDPAAHEVARAAQQAVGIRSNNQSGFKGVSFSSARKKWSASIKIDQKSNFLGRFDNPAMAARAYDAAATAAFGPNCFLNFTPTSLAA